MNKIDLCNLDCYLMDDGTLIIKDVHKDDFDYIHRIILENRNDYDVPVVKTFYEE